MSKIQTLTKTETVDPKTGEILFFEKTSQQTLPSEAEYVKLYVADIARLLELKGAQERLLTLMAAHMDYENVVALTTAERRRWASHLGISVKALNNTLSSLVKSSVILRKDDGEYIVDPDLFSKGSWKAVIEKREAFDAHFIVSYSADGNGTKRKIKTAKLDSNQPPLPGI